MPTARVNDIQLYYEIDGQGDPLVFIGGLATDVTQYHRYTTELARRHRIIAFDNRGAGRSDKPDTPYSIPLMAEDAYGLLQSLGVGRVDVLGHSLGGRIALELTLSHPELVRSLILVSTSARVGSGRRLPLARALLRVPLLRTWDTRYPQPYHAFMRQFEASTGYDATGRLHEIHSPTLILHGRRDRTAPFALAEELHRGINGSRLVAFSGGHLFLFMSPRPFIEAVEVFLAAEPPLTSPGS